MKNYGIQVEDDSHEEFVEIESIDHQKCCTVKANGAFVK
jgi:hypothetical protein